MVDRVLLDVNGLQVSKPTFDISGPLQINQYLFRSTHACGVHSSGTYTFTGSGSFPHGLPYIPIVKFQIIKSGFHQIGSYPDLQPPVSFSVDASQIYFTASGTPYVPYPTVTVAWVVFYDNL